MTQKHDQMSSSLSVPALNSQENPENNLSSAFDQPEIQTTLAKTQLQAEQLTHTPALDKIPASTRRIKPLNNFLGQDRARASVEAGISLPYSGYNIFAVGWLGQAHHGQAFTTTTRQKYADTERLGLRL